MLRFPRPFLLAAGVVAGLIGPGAVAISARGSAAVAQPSATAVTQPMRAGGQLASFKSDAEFLAFLEKRRQAVRRRNAANPSPPAPPPSPNPRRRPTWRVRWSSPARRSRRDRITNTQEADVDEGGIVKKRGDLLVILRRGRLFTVSIAGGQMRPIDHINAFPPGITGGGDWYDEMLISGDRVIVIGYSYARGGTEVNRFRLSPDGRLRFEDAYHLRSNDYYSSRNYASRLIGNRLVYYTPLYLGWRRRPVRPVPGGQPLAAGREARLPPRRPGARRLCRPLDARRRGCAARHAAQRDGLQPHRAGAGLQGDRGARPRQPHLLRQPDRRLSVGQRRPLLARRRARRRAKLALPPARSTGSKGPRRSARSARPTDQFSFREDRSLGLVDVLLRADGGGDAMWNNENSDGGVALLSVPIRWMGDGSRRVPLSRYRRLPPVGADEWNFQNRFVGNHILYGGHAYQRGQFSTLVAAGLRGGPVAQLQLPHAVERLDQLGQDGVVIGNDPRGRWSSPPSTCAGRWRGIGNSFTFPNAQQGENRSQAFFYPARTMPDGSNGLLGLPITTQLQSQFARFLGSGSSILFLKRQNRLFDLAGRLDADPYRAVDDACVASCVDWYGNARPIFIGNRVFALMGYELVEGRTANGAISEVARTNFAPPARVPVRR